MLSFVRKRQVITAYGVATVLVFLDDEEDRWLHIVRKVEAAHGRVFGGLHLTLSSPSGPSEDLVDEALGAMVRDVIAGVLPPLVVGEEVAFKPSAITHDFATRTPTKVEPGTSGHTRQFFVDGHWLVETTDGRRILVGESDLRRVHR